MGDLAAAQQAFNTAYELDPDLGQARVNLDVITYKLDSIAAVQGLEEGKELNSKADPKEFEDPAF